MSTPAPLFLSFLHVFFVVSSSVHRRMGIRRSLGPPLRFRRKAVPKSTDSLGTSAPRLVKRTGPTTFCYAATPSADAPATGCSFLPLMPVLCPSTLVTRPLGAWP